MLEGRWLKGLPAATGRLGLDFWAKAALLKLSANPRASASRFMALRTHASDQPVGLAHRRSWRRAVPDGVAERDEIGAGLSQRPSLCNRAGVGDARRLEDLGPPDHPLGERHQRRQATRLCAATRLPEHHVIRPHFACIHRLITGAQGSCPDDPFRFQALDRLDKIVAVARDMDAIRAKPGRQPGVVFNQQRTVGVPGGTKEGRDDRFRMELGAGREADERAGDCAASSASAKISPKAPAPAADSRGVTR